MWSPTHCCTSQQGENASFTPEVIIGNVQATIEELYTKVGVRVFVVAGLPVTGCLPLVHMLTQLFRLSCLTKVATSLVWLWTRCGADLFQAMCLQLERSHPGCQVFFFDEAAALERVVSSDSSAQEDIWFDVLHPSVLGHSLLEADFKTVWSRWEEQRGPLLLQEPA